MCLIVFAHNIVPGYELVLIANRDEFLSRPTARLNWWPDQLNILAGKDLVGGGTWLGVNKQGDWTAITNFREPQKILPDAPSRGLLTKRILENNLTLLYGNFEINPPADSYMGFNLLHGNHSGVGYFSNRSGHAHTRLPAGYYGLSNHLLDTAWPKVDQAKKSFIQSVGQGRVNFSELFEILGNDKQAGDSILPDTGVGYEWEKRLSSAFINAEEFGYGTRLRTILTISERGEIQMCEWKRGEEAPGQIFSFQRA